MKIALLMNPLSSLLIDIDTSLALMEAAQTKGWDCFYFTLPDLFCKDDEPYAHLSRLSCQSGTYSSEKIGIRNLTELDLILMRQDPPFDSTYLYATYALELAEKKGVLVANKPQGLRDFNEKMSILNFPQCIVPTLVTSNMQVLREFWDTHQEVIYKPLDGMGGRSVFFVGQDSSNIHSILELLTQNQQRAIMAQRYIPQIRTTGDKRVLLINGEPIPYGLARIPKKGELRGNIVSGATGLVLPLTERDYWICDQLKQTFRDKSLSFVGIDIIGDYLTEINVTSPSCLREIEAETGINIADQYLSYLEQVKNQS